MLEGAQGRDRLMIADGGFVTRRGRERFDLAALQRIAATEPKRLSPNVLLRPVIESALLPTVAYLAGPGELRYLALTPPVYRAAAGTAPAAAAALVRHSGRAAGGSGAGEVRHRAGRPAGAGRRAGVAAGALAAAGRGGPRAGDASGRRSSGLRGAGHERRPRSIRRWPVRCRAPRHQALSGMQDVEKKLVQHLKRRQEIELGQIARARTAVLPDNKPQERVLTVAPFLARYGPALVTELGEAIEGWYATALEGPSTPS